MKDEYGNVYELYSGKVYITGKMYGDKKIGNIAVLINGKLKVISFGELTKENIEKAIVCMGWEKEK